MIKIKGLHTPSVGLILVTDPPTNDSHLMMNPWTHGSVPWTQST
jgi:hypothetical protein